MKFCIKKVLLILSLCFIKNVECNDTYESSYLTRDVLSLIDAKEVKLIVEVGAFDCRDSVLLTRHFQCPVISFECAPKSIIQCKQTIKDVPYVRLVEMAVAEKTSPRIFNYCPTHPGSSSLYHFDYESMEKINQSNKDLDTVEKLKRVYPMESILITATRLDDWLQANKIPQVDYLCIDAQGNTLPVLKSMGRFLSTVKYVVAEVEYRSGYKGEALFPDIKNFMDQNGFTAFFYVTNPGAFFNDVLFVNNKYLPQQLLVETANN